MSDVWTSPAVFETNLAGLGRKRQGKVRDMYDLGDSLLLIASDRISAFDVVLPEGIPGKGYVLTQLSKFWFDRLWQDGGLVPHHLRTMNPEEFPESCRPHVDLLAGRSMLVEKADPLPVECIVRGYLSGSAWKEYRTRGTVCAQPLPAGLRESEKFPEPLFTPSTKATEGHDENISYDTMKDLIGEELAEHVKRSASRCISARRPWPRSATFSSRIRNLNSGCTGTRSSFWSSMNYSRRIRHGFGPSRTMSPGSRNPVSTSNSSGITWTPWAGITPRPHPICPMTWSRRPARNIEKPSNAS